MTYYERRNLSCVYIIEKINYYVNNYEFLFSSWWFVPWEEYDYFDSLDTYMYYLIQKVEANRRII